MSEPPAEAQSILATMQARVDSRNVEMLVSLFDESAVLIGASGDGRNPDALRRYLTAVATQPGALRWDWQEIIPFYEHDDALGFAAFGEVVISDESGEQRAPIRGTFVAVRTPDGWKLLHFHGSIPATS